MRNEGKKIWYVSKILCFAIRCVTDYESPRPIGLTVGLMLKLQKYAGHT